MLQDRPWTTQDSGEKRGRMALSSGYLEDLERSSEACSSLSSGSLLDAWPRHAYLHATAATSPDSTSSSSITPSIPTTFVAASQDAPPPAPAPAPSSSRPSSSSSSSAQQPPRTHIPPLPLTGPQYGYYPPVAVHRKTPPRIPEKCLTWCSQKDGAPAMCRMLCLRKRQPLPTQSEALAKLRPPRADDQASVGIFEALRARLAPYSIIYVRGTAEGVVGRYMEELDEGGDDGQYDFGPFSRHAPETIRRQAGAGNGPQGVLNWGEDVGMLWHLPLTSLFWPILNLPANLHRVLDPPARLVDRYINSFADGTQTRALERLTEEIKSGGAATLLGKMVDFRLRKWEEASAKDLERKAEDDKAKIARDSDQQ